MQKDYMSMAQGQQAPAQDERAATIENITIMAQQAGMFKKGQEEMMTEKIEELADLIVAGDQEAVEANQLYQALMNMLAQAQDMQQPGSNVPGEPGQPPKDFTSMMPPTPGGGMGGR